MNYRKWNNGYFNIAINKPPCFTPEPNDSLCKEDLHTLENFTRIMVYIWSKGEVSFWFYTISISQFYFHGYAWNGQKWVYVSIRKNLVTGYF